jgi:hypothetical protein
MKIQITVLSVAFLSLSVAGCGGDDSGGGATTGCTSAAVTTSPQPMTCAGTNLVSSSTNNYVFHSTMSLPSVTVKSMTNLTFDWSAVTKNFLGNDISTTGDLNLVTLLLLSSPLADVETKLNADTLSLQDVVVIPPPSWPAPGASTGGMTTAKLYDFKANGEAIAPALFDMNFDPTLYPPSMFTYMATVAKGITPGEGNQMLQAFKLDPGASATTVALKNDSTRLTCDVSLRNLTITGVTAGTAALTLSWQQMVDQGAKNALGNVFMDNYITRAIVGHFTESPEQLEKKFLSLDVIATKYYSADIITGSTLDFTTLKDSSGAAFPGVDDTGTWMVGLICGNCRNPAPWYMTILKPCTP